MTEQDRRHYETRQITIRSCIAKMQGVIDANEPTEIGVIVKTNGPMSMFELILLPSAKECGEDLGSEIFTLLLNAHMRAQKHIEEAMEDYI